MPMELYGDIVRCTGMLWKLLTTCKGIPNKADDVYIEHIKPTRNHWLSILKGLPDAERVHMHNWLVYIEMVVKDRINIADEVDKEKQNDNVWRKEK
jgi:hypothetical protein